MYGGSAKKKSGADNLLCATLFLYIYIYVIGPIHLSTYTWCF